MDAIRLPVHLSPELTEFMGLAFCPRADVTKRVWDYVKANNLQNPADRREIFCDPTLEKLFNKKKFSMFKLSKYLCEVSFNTTNIGVSFDHFCLHMYFSTVCSFSG
jgi:chromatin remodeling complex protein RSC6